MIIGLLTSSRADYGIYRPLIIDLNNDPGIDLNLLVFGTHLSDKYGKTVDLIKADGFKILCEINTLIEGDAPSDISLSMAKTITGFTRVWQHYHFDLIFALGDRYEMFAAVASTVPFNIPVAHIHGGETTTGAIDNAFRHAITCMAKYHFTSTDQYADRVRQIIGSNENIYNVGALSIDALKSTRFLTTEEFCEIYGIDLSNPTILITFHPETINFNRNDQHVNELISALSELKDYQQVITMPNADTNNVIIRDSVSSYAKERHNVFCIESFGSLGYLSCMKHCSFMLGNTSSGFVEASFFPKHVINLGNRQNGRIVTPNINNCEIKRSEIIKSIRKIEQLQIPDPVNIYGDGATSENILTLIKSL